MNTLQILKIFQNRTEHKILKEWAPIVEKEIESLAQGTTIIPGIILNKLSVNQMMSIIQWIKEWGNQLILVPPWRNIDLGQLLGLSSTVEIKEEQGEFQGIPTNFIIQSNSSPKWQNGQNKTVAIDIKPNLGGGTITITTVPLLDYRLLKFEPKNKELFFQLVIDTIPEINNSKEVGFQLSKDHLHILLLAAADIDITNQLEKKIKIHFSSSVKGKKDICEDLLYHGFLDKEWRATEKTQQMLIEKGYRAFIRELRKQGDMFE